MPIKVERKLKRQAAKKGLTGDRAYELIYGTMCKMGLVPKRPIFPMSTESASLSRVWLTISQAQSIYYAHHAGNFNEMEWKPAMASIRRQLQQIKRKLK